MGSSGLRRPRGSSSARNGWRPELVAAIVVRMIHRYLLGDSRREAARLRRQARLWDPVAAALFERLQVGRGLRVLEVGPGQGSLHLTLRHLVGGPVDAVEPSLAFCQRLKRLCARTVWAPA